MTTYFKKDGSPDVALQKKHDDTIARDIEENVSKLKKKQVDDYLKACKTHGWPLPKSK